jgi:predicted aconitase
MRDADGLACVGAVVACEVFRGHPLDVPDIVCVGDQGFRRILEATGADGRGSRGSVFGAVLTTGEVVIGDEASVESAAVQHIENRPLSSDRHEESDLTPEEEDMLRHCSSEAERMALNVLFKYARLVSTNNSIPRYVPVAGAHIDGCTYIGPGGLEFVRMLVEAGGRVKVPTTLNSVSADRRRWRDLGVPEEYARNSLRLGDAYLELGCAPSFTCAPYLLSSPPRMGQDVAWGESNAVVYANSVLGARTEKYADYLDICCALAGVVPAVGVHLAENRVPSIVLDATDLFMSLDEAIDKTSVDMLFPLLGHACGTLSDGKVPLVIGLERWSNRVTPDDLKSFCAAFGTTGSSPLIHVSGITPEARDEATVRAWVAGCAENCRVVSRETLEDTFMTLDSGGAAGSDEQVQLVALGNPHLSASECERLAGIVARQGQPKNPAVRVVACLSRDIQQTASQPHLRALSRWGVELVNDTCWCMLLDPPLIPADRNARILTNSGKYSHYGPGLTNRVFRFGSLEDCIRTATTGAYRTGERALWRGSETKRNYTSSAFPVARKILRFWL